MNEAPRVSFDYTIDEAVEVYRQHLKESPVARSLRRRQQGIFAGCLVVGGLLVIYVRFRGAATIPLFAAGFALLVMLGVVLSLPFGWYHDRCVKDSARRFLLEQLGGDGPYHCCVEARTDGLWTSQRNLEITFPWKDAVAVHDREDGITVVFKAGRVLVRSRGFASAVARDEFRSTVYSLVPNHRPGKDHNTQVA